MDFREKLQLLRQANHMSQEDVAEVLNVSRQAVAKWETGGIYPDIDNLIGLSELFKVTIDSLVKKNSECSKRSISNEKYEFQEIITFLCKAKKNTYAAGGKEDPPSRLNSHDLSYKEGNKFYFDTYIDGAERFCGEEAVWILEKPVWSMNYVGRILDEEFSGDFLKECLLQVSEKTPFRGPAICQNKNHIYTCSI